jgi:RHS repeat-associated protein
MKTSQFTPLAIKTPKTSLFKLMSPLVPTLVRTLLLALTVGGAVPQLAQAQSITRASSFTYNPQGLLASETIEPDLPQSCLQTSYTYDAYGNKTVIGTGDCATGAVRTASATYAAQTVTIAGVSYTSPTGLFATSNANALGHTETKEYDPRFGGITKLTGPNGLATTWTYDTFGRKTRETRADGTYTTWTYNLCTDAGITCPAPIGGLASYTQLTEASFASSGGALSPPKYQFNDVLGRTLRTQSVNFTGQVLVSDKEYNVRGQLTRYSNTYKLVGGTPLWTTQTYDALDRLVKSEGPDPDAPNGISTTTMAYNGMVTSTTNNKGQTKTTTKNVAGLTANITDTLGNAVVYTYDALGQLLQTNAAGSITTLTYNQRGQKIGMIDPAMGRWDYVYNVFGELLSQTDSIGKTTTMAYDLLGRMTQRNEPDLISQWYFDKNFAGVACGKSIGKLCEAKADNGYNRKHSYDSLGRANTTATVLDSATTPATMTVAYDAANGRVASKTWPTGYKASYTYNTAGYMTKVTGAPTTGTAAQITAQTVSHEILAISDQGQITQYKTGNQVITNKDIDVATGRLKSQTATLTGQASGNILNQSYTYDSLGNLTTRADNTVGVGTSEVFAYDNLNRLTMSTFTGGAVSPPTSVQVMYDERGNIKYKSDVGTYYYDGARPNRLTNITLEAAPPGVIPLTGTRALSYAFDDYLPTARAGTNGVITGNGNLMYTVSQDIPNNRHTARWETYTSFNMPSTINFGGIGASAVAPGTNAQATAMAGTVADKSMSFIYGPEHQRIKQVSIGGPAAGTVWYMNGEDSLGLAYEKEFKATGVTEHKHYLSAGGITFAMFTSRVSTASGTTTGLPAGLATTAISYFNHDHLGSIVAITNEVGAVVERLAFDAWGKRRFTNGTVDTLDAISGQITHRGYTMHEHLEDMGIIHMNGRIYDPLIGRFMSADPYIQDASDLQSYNRYSYVRNNPMNLTDPSGYSWISKAWSKVWHSPIFKAVVGIVVAIYAPMLLTTLFPEMFVLGSFATTVATGALSGFATTGTLKGAMTGAFTAGIMFGAGEIGEAFKLQSGGIEKIALHAGAGCLSGMAGGGSCKSGAISGAFGEFGNNIGNVGNSDLLGAARGAMLGGIGSKISGGKFADGAITGSFGYLFNELLHSGNRVDAMKRAGYMDGGCSHPCDPPLQSSHPEELLLGGAGAAKAAWGLVKSVAAGTPSLIEGLSIAPEVGSALKADGGHYVAAIVREEALRVGTYATKVGGDGMARIEVTLQAVGGRFEYLYQQAKTGWEITHQFFKATPK